MARLQPICFNVVPVWVLVVALGVFPACVGGDERSRGTPADVDADVTQLDVPCPDNCSESYPVVPACSRAVWDDEACACRLEPLGELAPCDDNNACTLEDRCAAGSCQGRLVDLVSHCDDGDPCTVDRCDQYEGCVSTAADDGATCDDANDCTYDEACRDGACRWESQYVCSACDIRAAIDTCESAYGNGLRCDGQLACRSGFCEVDPATVPDCDDPRLDPCRVAACDPETGGCVTSDRPDGEACFDLSPCTKDDTCDDGVCSGARVEVAGCTCSGPEDCVGLDDGDLCNGVFTCDDGLCRFDFASIVVCDTSDDTACLAATCDPATGTCEARPEDDGTTCDDLDPCTDDDFCDSGVCAGLPRDCSDLDGTCVRGACDPLLGCVAAPADAGATCDPDIRCVDLGACTDGVCVAVGAPCDDGDPCTADTCADDGSCTHAGPPRPSCLAGGVCAATVPIVCEAGAYRCAYEQVQGHGEVELCDALDNDCDGATDDGCVDALACPDNTLVAAYAGGTMQACQATEAGAPACGAGFHVCSYTQMTEALGDLAPPSGYLIAASIAYDPANGYRVNDRAEGGCFEFQGLCSLGHEVQAISWDGVFAGAVAYAAEAWGCEGGEPTGSCAALDVAGVLCCGNVCSTQEDCEDDSPCTVDTCDVGRGRCVNQDKERPVCKTDGVCADYGVVCGANGTFACGYLDDPSYQAVETACDGLDNDCDGKTDAVDPDLAAYTPPCDRDVGVCAGARKSVDLCQGGRWRACTEATYLAHDLRYETGGETHCDALDNDCDGGTDNAFAYAGTLVGGPCDGVGACGEGLVVCGADQSSATCSTNPGAADDASLGFEDCNGQDDDCDGATDEPDDLDPGLAGCRAEGVCLGGVPATCDAGAAGAAPTWSCGYGDVPDYHEVERCDGRDDDCDGETDEGFVLAGDEDDGVADIPLGGECGSGDCQGGRVICAADGTAAICSSDLGGDVELCDGLDNDCDDQTDEGILYDDWAHGPTPLGAECSGRGECAAGVVACGASLSAVCSTLPGGASSQAGVETCNDRDDDCDGVTDDGLTYEGQPVGGACEGRGECGPGVVVCAAAGHATCSTNPSGTAPETTPEVCDGRDNDCDGAVDDGVVVGPDDCTFAGVCTPQSGTFTCAGEGGWSCSFVNVPYYQAGHEVGRCDGRDNDCDGATDEDFPGLGTTCDGPDDDQCKRGTLVCKADGSGTQCQGDVAAVESCNGVDDDCDGTTDEANAVGCVVYYKDQDQDGWGVAPTQCLCAKPANMAVQAGDCQDGIASINPGRPELCNGVDDDCDGGTDAAGDAADLIVDDPQPCELQAGVCGGAKKSAARCVGGAWQPCQAADYTARDARYQSAESSCDGADNDCDGQTDASDPGIAAFRPACSNQSGVCQGALTPVSSCTSSGWTPCGGAVYAAHSAFYESTQEVSCDGRDNDCDQGTDEPFTFAGKAVGQACDGTGSCGNGIVQCRADKTAATCSTNPDGSQPQATTEVCNNLDDDCDASTDEGLGVLQSTCRLVGQCNASNVQATCTQGTWICSYAGVPAYENGAEQTCDGLDNDCDGGSDEDFSLVLNGQTLKKGDPCGSGQCLGAVVCHAATPAPGDLVCSTSLAGQPEVCDNLDNNCNGQTDEGLSWLPPGATTPIPKGSACDGVGACGMGTVVCSASQTTTCSTNPDGTVPGNVPETCNGVDDDCDSVTDDGFAWSGVAVGRPCDGVGACGAGTVECLASGQGATCSTNPDGSQSQDDDEHCNGQDDDCDGGTDEGLGVYDSDCDLEGVCTPQTVVATCTGQGGWTCSYAAVPGYHAGDEVGWCDGLDNDCDGLTDEDDPEVGDACDTADADLCAYGVWTCNDGMSVEPVPGGAEPGDDTVRGEPVCVGDSPSPERCGGGDEDCDGQTDEPNAADCQIWFRDVDEDGFGDHSVSACLCAADAKTFMTSQSGEHDCDDTLGFVNPDADEICDELDDDCDGLTDEDGALGCEDRYFDGDLDTFGISDARCVCEDWQGEATKHTAKVDGDCDDGEPTVYPEAPERCDGLDNDCDGPSDEGQDNIDCTVYYRDVDNDSYGSTTAQCLCAPTGQFDVTNQADCCDADPRVNPAQDDFSATPAAQGCTNPWDFDCNNVVERFIENSGSCACEGDLCNTCKTTVGWAPGFAIPACGQTAPYLVKCNRTAGLTCLPETRHDVRQSCR